MSPLCGDVWLGLYAYGIHSPDFLEMQGIKVMLVRVFVVVVYFSGI